jgi:hypothetical protein
VEGPDLGEENTFGVSLEANWIGLGFIFTRLSLDSGIGSSQTMEYDRLNKVMKMQNCSQIKRVVRFHFIV